MLLVSIDSCPDRVSARLQAEAVRAGVAQAALRVEAGLPVAEAAARVAGAAAQVPAGAPVRLVGAGLAASLLLAAASGLPAGRDLQVLALFPWLGCDSTVYGEPAIEPVAASRWMALARRPPWRTLLAHVAVSPPPRGLEGVYAGGVPSWRDAAGALPGADVVSLAAPVACDVTLVLNGACPTLDLARARVLLPALNPRLVPLVGQPDAPELAAAVLAWAVDGSFAATEALDA